MNIIIEGGRVIDPASAVDQITDLYISNGEILALGEAPAGFISDERIDAHGQIVCPGLIDLCAHLREPGETHKGTIASETAAAAAGGITTLITPPTTRPVVDTPAVAELIQDRAADAGFTRVLPMGALTQGLLGEQLAPLHALASSGCVAFTNARSPVTSSLSLLRCLEYAATFDLLVIFQAQDHSLAASGCMHEGANATRMGLSGIPEAAETIEVARCLLLVEQTGVRAHFGQITCERSVQLISAAQQRGLKVTTDVAVHHLILSDEQVNEFNSALHLQPPLRSALDRAGLLQGLLSQTITAICSDHQPQDLISKQAPFAETAPGLSGLETLLPLCLTLVERKLMELPQLIEKLTLAPARILGLDSGSLMPGQQADICIFDPQENWTVSAENLHSAGKNSPFNGQTLTGRVTTTLIGGKVVFRRH
ncbi:dihydroorotase [Nitrincola sp.]|uniref:dihydroorotase n=1 Tax=Nitrincola sp. TaxID=1926584 RepID=UPI003A9529A0